MTYSSQDRTVATIDATGQVTRYGYDNLYRLTSVTQPDPDGDTGAQAAPVTRFGYDANGNRTSVTDPLNHTTRTEYDALNRVKRVIDALSGVTSVERDAVGNITASTDALNRTAGEKGATTLVNLASEEYFKSVKPRQLAMPVVTPQFEDWKNGKYKIISFYAKRARGLMARYAAVNGVTDPRQLKHFDVDGYSYVPDASNDKTWLFRRKLAA